MRDLVSRSALRDGTTIRFLLVGVAATSIHAMVAYAVSSSSGLSAATANVCGFFSAYVFASIAHFRFTFRRRSGFLRSSARYFMVVAAALAASTLFALILVELTRSDLITALGGGAVSAVVSFVGSRQWAFAQVSRGSKARSSADDSGAGR